MTACSSCSTKLVATQPEYDGHFETLCGTLSAQFKKHVLCVFRDSNLAGS
eukprot:m.14564 g.14564  ORF g.14564 m.14564 type:complete len:50 (+) comp6344_c0_seq1:92-241(+)